MTRVRTPPFFLSGLIAHGTTVEMTAGYRVTREWTLRGGYIRQRGYVAPDWDNQAAVSIVWAKRWFY